MIQEQARVTVKVEDEDVCVKMEEAEEVEEKPSTSLLDSLLYDDDSDDVLITEAYTRSKKEMAEEEIKHYREMPKHKSPLLFFKENQVKLPNLSKLSKKYLVAQATSVTAERVFSTSGDILSSERSCLEADSLDCMIFLKKTADINSTFLV